MFEHNGKQYTLETIPDRNGIGDCEGCDLRGRRCTSYDSDLFDVCTGVPEEKGMKFVFVEVTNE